MLINLHVKNFALIDEADIDLGEGLNILTGETGAGKSILIDSVNAALGSRLKTDVIGKYGDSAGVELLFSVENEAQRDGLKALGLDVEYDSIIISRKIQEGRSVHRINGETASVSKVKAAAELLIDIHGQHEHQSLTHKKKHLEILDMYAGNDELRKKTEECYRSYRKLQEESKRYSIDTEERKRELDFIRYELNEIESASIARGEKEELTEIFKRYKNSARIAESISEVMREIGGDRDSASEKLSRAVRAIRDAAALDESLAALEESLAAAEDLLSEIYREADDYAGGLNYSDEDYKLVSDRLDAIHHIEQKYGSGYDAIEAAKNRRIKRIEELENFEEAAANADMELKKSRDALDRASEELSESRETAICGLEKAVTDSLYDLNFLDVRFEIRKQEMDECTALGKDDVVFMISMNPGEELKPLSEVASGGELSRIMLGLKTVMSDREGIPTLIFDEIDSGISGRTAQMVSQKLHRISRDAQVICITHLPQIASMADEHFCIEKSASGNRTVTHIARLDGESEIKELARLLGGAELTDKVYENAREMKALANEYKKRTT